MDKDKPKKKSKKRKTPPASMDKVEPKKKHKAAPKRKLSMRRNNLKKKDYYMALAFLSGQRSKDPRTQVGACIVNNHDRVVGLGYNGLPNDLVDHEHPNLWRDEEKDPYVCHAELNAIVNKYTADVTGCTMYVSLFPCNNCAKLIVQSGIKKVVYYSDKKSEKQDTVDSKNLLTKAGVMTTPCERQETPLMVDFNSIETEPA